MNLVFGFNEIEEKIKISIRNNNLHHCTMLVGEKGIGKSKFLYNIASLLLSEKTNGTFGNIENAFKLVENKSHPDLLVLDIDSLDINDEKNESKKGEINVKQARVIPRDINLTNSLSKNKVVIIDSMDELNINAQNALLKTLEEPPLNTYILITCHNANKVLDTILSRVNIIRINKLNFNNYKKALVNANSVFSTYENDELQFLYETSNSSISNTIKIVENDGMELYETILDIIFEKNIITIQEIAKKIDGSDVLFDVFKLIMENIFHTLINYFSLDNIMFKEKIDRIMIEFDIKTIFEKYDYYRNIVNDIDTYNLSKLHCISVLLLKI